MHQLWTQNNKILKEKKMENTYVRSARQTTVEILKCSCKHDYQDERYGKNMRLYNLMLKDGKDNGWRCTVCGNVKK